MSIRDDLRTYLRSQSTITDIVGEHIYPVVLPQGIYPAQSGTPAITYARVSSGSQHKVSGAAGAALPTFELVCWGTYAAADALSEALRQVMQGFGGTMGSTPVYTAVLDDDVDNYVDADDGSDNGDYTITLRYRIGITESVPTL